MWLRSLLLSALLLASVGAPAYAGEQHRHGAGPQTFIPQQNRRDRNDNQRREIRSLREIVSMMQSRFGGELISARLEDGDRPFYVLRWRTGDNQVRDFEVDAESGQVR